MTANRLYKEQVRRLAKLNGLTYVEAKRQLRLILNPEVQPLKKLPVIDEKALTHFATDGLGLPLGITDSSFAADFDAAYPIAGVRYLETEVSDGSAVVWDPTNSPHMLIDGIPGSGKTVFAKQLIQHATAAGWNVQVIDDKSEYPTSVCGGSSVISAFTKVNNEMSRRMAAFADARASGIDDYNNKSAVSSNFQRTLLVYDSVKPRFLDNNESELQNVLIERILKMGRSFGVHCVLLTQAPVEEFSQGIQNFVISVSIAGRKEDRDSEFQLGIGTASLVSPKGDRLPFSLGAFDTRNNGGATKEEV